MMFFLIGFVEEHNKRWTDGNNTYLMKTFLSKLNDTEDNYSFTDDQLLKVTIDMLIAGAHTAGGTLTYACFLMLVHQDVQEKVQKELDENCSNNHCYRFSDRQKLSYIQTVLLELICMYHILPIAGSRRAIRETQISSYTIPKRANLGGPRSIQTRKIFERMSKFVPFGFGRRRCLGESLACMSLFIIFAK